MSGMLARRQTAFLDALYGGPDRMDSALFTGSTDDISLAMRVYANTVNHARIVALEDTYPITRSALGAETFHTLAQAHIDTGLARAEPIATIGRNFADRIVDRVTDSQAVILARVEWAWLESYRAADAAAMTMDALADIDPEKVLAMAVACHPATQLVRCPQGIPAALGLDSLTASAIAIVRPQAEVRLIALDDAEAAMIAEAAEISSIGNLFAAALEILPEADPGAPLARLIGAGAFEAETK